MENKSSLNSVLLNQLIKICTDKNSKDLIMKLKNESIICHNILLFTRRHGQPLNYIRDIQPLVELVATDEEFCVKNEGRFKPEDMEWGNFDDDFGFGTPLLLDEKEEDKMIKQLIGETGTINASSTLLPGTTAEEAIKHDLKMLEVVRNVRKNGYKGRYHAAANLLSDIAFAGNPVLLTEAGLLWSHVEAEANIGKWFNHKKIYRVSDTLEDDFINQKDILVPADALRFLPFRSFAIDISSNAILGRYFDSVIVTVNEFEGNYVVDCKVYDKCGLLVNNGFQIAFTFIKDKDTNLSEEYLDNLYQKDYLNYYDKIKDDYSGIAMQVKKLKESRNPLANNYVNMTDKEFAYRVKKLTGIQTDEGGMADVSAFENYRRIPPKKYKQLERFLFCTLFYLCCSNKKTKRTYRSESTGESKGSANTVILETEDLGFEMENPDTLPEISFGELKIDEVENDADAQGRIRRGGKKGSKKKPHLVRGHFHHYRCGKGKKDTVYKYTAPYYTGTKKNIVSVTTLK